MYDTAGPPSSVPFHNETARTFYDHSSANRVNTDVVLVEALRREYPQLHLTIVPVFTCNLLAFASSGDAAVIPADSAKDRLVWTSYAPPSRRLDGLNDRLYTNIKFGKFILEWKNREYVLFIADGRDGTSSYPTVVNQYILGSGSEATERLLMEAGRWTNTLREAVWVFDQGYWQQSRELWESVRNAKWEDVILDQEMKDGLIKDINTFFDGRDVYGKLKVPWKRGVIYYGPPGNGKTISIKAAMHMLASRQDSIPTLYVKTLTSYAGPEASVAQIFNHARRNAPCYLVFEDLDTIVTPQVKSYFFNEVDGLKNNDGIFMVGSTNHIDRLDPGISKRPSRFDRKRLFPNPNEAERTQYAKFWQQKLKDNKDVEFPDHLCPAIAKITEDFSFAYMQEAFVAALLAIAGRAESKDDVAIISERTRSVTLTKSAAERIDKDVKAIVRLLQACSQTAQVGDASGMRVEMVVHAKQFNPVPRVDQTFDAFQFDMQLRMLDKRNVLKCLQDKCIVPSRSSLDFQEINDENTVKASGPLREAVRVFQLSLVENVVVTCNDLTIDLRSLLRPDGSATTEDPENPRLDHLVLWQEMNRQVKVLRDEMDGKTTD